MLNQRKSGVILSYVGQLVQIIIGVIYTPIMLRLLGQSEYGLYQLVYSVVSYLSLLSLGFGSSYLRFYSRYKAQEDEEGVAKLNGMFMIIFCSISVICVICGIVMIGNVRKQINDVFSDLLTYQKLGTVHDFYLFANVKENNFTGGMMKENNLTSYLLNFVELLAYLTHMYPNLAPKKIIDLVATKEELKRKRK